MMYHWIRDVLDAKLLELSKVHIDYSSYDMMTKVLPRGKLETCCDIVRWFGDFLHIVVRGEIC